MDNLYRVWPPSSTRSLHELVALHTTELPAIAIMAALSKPTLWNALNIPPSNPGDSIQCRSGQTIDPGARVLNRLDVSVRVLAATAMSASMGNTVQLMQVQAADPNMSLGSQVSHTRRE
jgi:hypothetical protein